MKKLYLLLVLTGVLFQANADITHPTITTTIANNLPLSVTFNIGNYNGIDPTDGKGRNFTIDPGFAYSFSVYDSNGSAGTWTRYIDYKVTVQSAEKDNSLRIRTFGYNYNRFDSSHCDGPFYWFNYSWSSRFPTYYMWKMCGQTQPFFFDDPQSTGMSVNLKIHNLLDINYIVGKAAGKGHDNDIINRCNLSVPGSTMDDIEYDLIHHGKIAYKQPIYCSRADTPDVTTVENKDFDYFGALSAKFDKGQVCIVQVDNEGRIGCLPS